MFTKESKRIVATENSSEGSIKFILKVSSQLTLWISKITFFAFDTLCPPCVLPIYRNSLTTSNLSQLFCQLLFFFGHKSDKRTSNYFLLCRYFFQKQNFVRFSRKLTNGSYGTKMKKSRKSKQTYQLLGITLYVINNSVNISLSFIWSYLTWSNLPPSSENS